MEQRYIAVRELTAKLLCANEIIFSPIVHCHPLAEAMDLPRDFEFWMHYNIGMMRHASYIYVLQLEGWENSKGVKAEIKFARTLDIPIKYIIKESI